MSTIIRKDQDNHIKLRALPDGCLHGITRDMWLDVNEWKNWNTTYEGGSDEEAICAIYLDNYINAVVPDKYFVQWNIEDEKFRRFVTWWYGPAHVGQSLGVPDGNFWGVQHIVMKYEYATYLAKEKEVTGSAIHSSI
jgi:hypothetical protein